MTSWRKRVEEYVELRRSFGFKLLDARVGLMKFALFLQRRRAVRITIPLAMEWAQQDKTARPAEWARRLSFVRGFARHWSAHDSQTEVPSSGLLPHRPGRARPYLYSNAEVRKLLLAARRLPSTHAASYNRNVTCVQTRYAGARSRITQPSSRDIDARAPRSHPTSTSASTGR